MTKTADYGTQAWTVPDGLKFNNVNTMAVTLGSKYNNDDGAWNGSLCEITRTVTGITVRARGAADGGRLISAHVVGPINTAQLTQILNGTL